MRILKGALVFLGLLTLLPFLVLSDIRLVQSFLPTPPPPRTTTHESCQETWFDFEREAFRFEVGSTTHSVAEFSGWRENVRNMHLEDFRQQESDWQSGCSIRHPERGAAA